MKSIRMFAVVLVLVVTAACKAIIIKDGEIPSEFLGNVEPYLGNFSGQFEGVEGALRLWLDDGSPRALYSSQSGNDILGGECGSQIGSLKEIGMKRPSPVGYYTYLSFWFSAGTCKQEVWGKEIVLFFNEAQSEIIVRILKGAVWKSDSSWCSNEPYPGPDWCKLEPESRYLEGVFVLQGK